MFFDNSAAVRVASNLDAQCIVWIGPRRTAKTEARRATGANQRAGNSRLGSACRRVGGRAGWEGVVRKSEAERVRNDS